MRRLFTGAERRDFTLLWVGQSISQLGSRMYGTALIMWTIALTGSPTAAALTGTVTFGAFTVALIGAGAVADGLDRRRVMMASDAVSAVATGSLAASAAAGVLIPVHVAVVGVLLGIGWAVRSTVEQAALPQVVAAGELGTALALSSARSHANSLAGPPLAGGLFGVSPALPFVVDSASFVVAMSCAGGVRRPLVASRAAEVRAAPLESIRDGFRLLRTTAFLRVASVLNGTVEFVGAACGLAVVVVLDDGGATASEIGLVLGLAAVGGIAGSLAAARLAADASAQRLPLVVAPTAAAAALVGLAVAPGLTLTPLLFGVFLACQPAWDTCFTARVLTAVDDGVRGRAQSAAFLVAGAAVTAAPLTCAAALSAVGPESTFIGLAVLLALVAAIAARSPAINS